MNNKRLIAFDMDGVLTKHPSSWSFVHRHFGVNNSTNYSLYRSGRISYSTFMEEDVRLWLSKQNPISQREMLLLMEEIPLMDNLYQGLQVLREKGYVISIVSGGLSWLSDRISKHFSFDRVFNNAISVDGDGNIMPGGIIGVIPEKKNLAIRKMQEEMGIREENTISVGDSDFDVSMFDASGFRIAFNPRSQGLVSAADLILYSEDFNDLVHWILKSH